MALQGDASKTGSCQKNAWFEQVLEEQRTELDVLKTKYENLQREWDNQQEHLGRLQGEAFKLRNQLQTQSSYCASLGAIMGNLVWKASRLQPVVELLLTTNKLAEFFCLVSSTLVSFMETYSREVPDVKCDETQFILSMGGIVANLAAVPEGRQYIVSDFNGKELIEQIIKLLPAIPVISGDPLKRILLMVLYNISINQTGIVLIQDQKPLLVAVSNIIVSEHTPELKVLALRLLESITFEIPNGHVLLKIQQFIPRDKLELLKDSTDAQVRQHCVNILGNLKKADVALGKITLANSQNSSYIPKEECLLVDKTER